MKKIIITDIGSTTTKALLLIKDNQNQLIFRDIQNSSTTVEKPFEDVNIGVFNSIKLLEKSTKLKLLRNSEPYNIIFEDDITYLSTSSAGGGLQILVVGLTLFDSGSSAKRAAFGAGGVLLDVFSIDDKRSNLEKINLIKILHPDIILFSGGTDNGAVTPIIRLGEILMLGSPKPKFSINSKLPLIYAGNKEVQPYISDLFADSYELHLIPNIRPALKKENLKPARDKIHELFMDSVMEQAPGYSRLKKVVNKDIIPTPSGVLNSLEILSTQNQGNILAVDIGGATTDIFSNMNDKFNRTVSANYGMSYSISNVMKDANFDKIKRWLPANLKENYIKNYISNKMLNPTFTTNNETLLAIEHAIAREALYLAKEQHLDMSFNSKRIGFLDKIKLKKNNKFMEKLYYAENLENEIFSLDDFDFFIGAGGVISHTKNNIQALQIIAAGLQAKGITKIWRDKHFITPHLGKLAEIDKESATKLLENDALKKLGMVIRPYGKKWKKGKKVIDITVNDKEYLVKVGDYIFIENKKQLNVNYSMHKGFAINNIDAGSFVTNYPMIIDATIPNEIDFEQINSELDLYDFSELISQESLFETENIEILEKTLEQTISLPYDGEIKVKEGQSINSGDIVGINKFEPPIIYILTIFDKTYLNIDKNNIKEHLLIKVGDEIQVSQKIAKMADNNSWKKILSNIDGYYSSVRGIVESIDYNVGTIIVRELQDYDTKPVIINIAKQMNIEPNRIGKFLRKVKGEFVHQNDILARRLVDKTPIYISSPTTGTIKKIDKKNGTITIQYDKKLTKKFCMVNGKVIETDGKKNVRVEFAGIKIEGKIGFGESTFGKLHLLDNFEDTKEIDLESIIFIDKKPSFDQLNMLASHKIKGLIIPGIDNVDLVNFIGEEIGIALTGNENIDYPIIIMEGFGDFYTPKNIVNLFKDMRGKDVYLKPYTQIRAGVSRPEIVFT